MHDERSRFYAAQLSAYCAAQRAAGQPDDPAQPRDAHLRPREGEDWASLLADEPPRAPREDPRHHRNGHQVRWADIHVCGPVAGVGVGGYLEVAAAVVAKACGF